MTEKEILSYLNKPYNKRLVAELELQILTDDRIINSLKDNLCFFVAKRNVIGDFNNILFIQAVKLQIDKILSSNYFKRNYSDYYPTTISAETRYQIASTISDYILTEYFKYCF